MTAATSLIPMDGGTRRTHHVANTFRDHREVKSFKVRLGFIQRTAGERELTFEK